MRLTCLACKTKNESNARACSHCLNDLTKQQKKIKKIMFAALVIVVVVICAFAYSTGKYKAISEIKYTVEIIEDRNRSSGRKVGINVFLDKKTSKENLKLLTKKLIENYPDTYLFYTRIKVTGLENGSFDSWAVSSLRKNENVEVTILY